MTCLLYCKDFCKLPQCIPTQQNNKNNERKKEKKKERKESHVADEENLSLGT
jgi:hypothetical protein